MLKSIAFDNTNSLTVVLQDKILSQNVHVYSLAGCGRKQFSEDGSESVAKPNYNASVYLSSFLFYIVMNYFVVADSHFRESVYSILYTRYVCIRRLRLSLEQCSVVLL